MLILMINKNVTYLQKVVNKTIPNLNLNNFKTKQQVYITKHQESITPGSSFVFLLKAC